MKGKCFFVSFTYIYFLFSCNDQLALTKCQMVTGYTSTLLTFYHCNNTDAYNETKLKPKQQVIPNGMRSS